MKEISKYITERGSVPMESYRVSFITDNGPVDATIYIDPNDSKNFESFLNNNEGDIFAHASGKNVEF